MANCVLSAPIIENPIEKKSYNSRFSSKRIRFYRNFDSQIFKILKSHKTVGILLSGFSESPGIQRHLRGRKQLDAGKLPYISLDALFSNCSNNCTPTILHCILHYERDKKRKKSFLYGLVEIQYLLHADYAIDLSSLAAMNKVGVVVVVTINQTSWKRGINPPTKNVIYPQINPTTPPRPSRGRRNQINDAVTRLIVVMIC